MIGSGAGADRVVEKLRAAGQTVAFAESLTAGLCAARIADVPGASAVLRGGLVVYATDLKASLAGVDQQLLDERGPVDGEVARQLARGAAAVCQADWGIGLTGVAGPDPQDAHPVGEVYAGIYGPRCWESKRMEIALKAIDETQVAEVTEAADGRLRREFIRESAIAKALSWLLECLS